MAFWLVLFAYVASFILSALLAPKPKTENARPAGLGQFNIPTASEDRVVPIVIGTCSIEGPNVLWYGDYSYQPIIEEIDTGFFGSLFGGDDSVITGYKYYLALQLGLCRGPIDQVRKCWYGDIEVNASAFTTSISVDKPNFFGGDIRSGGISGTLEVVRGVTDAAVNSFIAARQSPDVTYQNTAYILWRTPGYIGNSPQLRAWKFEVSRWPNGLGLASNKHKIGDDANPICFLYEILTDQDWGLGIPSSEVDTTNFTTAGNTCYDEGLGFSMVIDTPTDVATIIQEIERHVDGYLRLNIRTGKFEIKLARDDYDIGTVPALSEDNVLSLDSFTRGNWSETQNEVRLSYHNRAKSYQGSSTLAQDIANREIQQARSTATLQFPGCKTATLANQLAWRELRGLAFPVAKLTVKVNRQYWDIQPGDVFKFSWTDYGIASMAFRVIRLRSGTDKNGAMTIDAVQDIYRLETETFDAPPATQWTPPTATVAALGTSDQYAQETPPMLSADSRRILYMASRQGAGSPSYYERWQESRNPPTAFTGTYTQDGLAHIFTPIGSLVSAWSLGTTGDHYPHTGNVDVDPVGSEDLQGRPIESCTPDQINFFLKNIALLWDPSTGATEWIGFESVTNLAAGRIRLTRIWRGLIDTYPRDWSAGALVLFASYGCSEGSLQYTSGHDVRLKLLPVSINDAVTLAEATALPDIRVKNRRVLYPPVTRLKVNTLAFWNHTGSVSLDTTTSTTSGFGVTWTYSGRDPVLTRPLRHVQGAYRTSQDLTDSMSAYTALVDGYQNNTDTTNFPNQQQKYNWYLYFDVALSSLSSDPTTRRAGADMSGTVAVGTSNETFQVDRADIFTANGGVKPNSIVLELVTVNNNDSSEAWEPVFQEYNSITSSYTPP